MNDYFKEILVDKSENLSYTTGVSTDSKVTPGPVFIVMSGKKQTGKDTSTDIMVDLLTKQGKRVGVTAFAKALKDMCINVLGLKPEQVYGTNEQKDSYCKIDWDNFPADIRLKYSHSVTQKCDVRGVKYTESVPRCGPMTAREVLQVVGTDIFRNMIYGNVWAQAPFNQDWTGYDVVIITDCRFPNEKQVTEENRGIIIRLVRDTGLVDNHTSETALDGVDFKVVYYNNGTIEQLKSFLEAALKSWKIL